MSKYILGAGIAGLIAKKYNPDYEIISPDVGGQITKQSKILISFYVHNTQETRELCDEVGIPYTIKRIKILYYYNGKTYDKVPDEVRIRFIKHKMKEHDYDSDHFSPKDITLSTETGYIEYLDLDVMKLVALLQPASMIKGKVKLINTERQMMYILDDANNLRVIKYEKLISTIPAPDFFHMAYNLPMQYKFQYLPTVYVLSDVKPEFMTEDALYYVCDPDCIYNRVQKYAGGYLYEITGAPTNEEIYEQIPQVTEMDRRYVGLIKTANVDDMRNIRFIGRMAEWTHHVKVQHNISKAKVIANGKRKVLPI